ncbi:MAG: stage II sporulation protein P [Ruminococcus sp.]|nr:stage II sporulation protein P [Ruminococcus sp.]
MRYAKRRRYGKILKVTTVIVLPLIMSAVSFNMGMLKTSRSETSTLAEGESADAPMTETTESVTRSDSDFLSGSVILSQGYGIKPEIERGENYLELVPPLEQVSDYQGDVPYPTEWGGGGEIIRTTFGEYIGDSFFTLDNGGQVNNKTEISNDELISESWFMPNFKVENTDEPLVLLYHTHTCESYEPYVRDEFDVNFNFRSTDPTKSVVMVGDAIQAELEAQGIGVVHITDIHDYPSYNGAYDRSRASIIPVLEEYPSIKVVLDIHRDALGSDEQAYQPFIRVEGREAAQIMMISGCDDGTMGMPNCMENYHFACALQQKLEKDNPGFTRPILFDYRCYNQDLTNGSLLVEVGAHGNTLEQAQYAGQLFGKSLGEFLREMSEG